MKEPPLWPLGARAWEWYLGIKEREAARLVGDAAATDAISPAWEWNAREERKRDAAIRAAWAEAARALDERWWLRETEKGARNRRIYWMWVAGRPLREIAAWAGISVSRVGQICRRADGLGLR